LRLGNKKGNGNTEAVLLFGTLFMMFAAGFFIVDDASTLTSTSNLITGFAALPSEPINESNTTYSIPVESNSTLSSPSNETIPELNSTVAQPNATIIEELNATLNETNSTVIINETNTTQTNTTVQNATITNTTQTNQTIPSQNTTSQNNTVPLNETIPEEPMMNAMAEPEIETGGKFSVMDYPSCPDIGGNWDVSSPYTLNESIVCSNITISAALTIDSATAGNISVNITAYSINITASGSMNGDYKGYKGGTNDANNAKGPGAGGHATYAGGGGAGHGGYGGDGSIYTSGSVGGSSYGNFSNPFTIGSGGGAARYTRGGDGGGAVFINVTDTLLIDGIITADGEQDTHINSNNDDYDAGGGSGGSIYIIANTISGSGSISADGGCGEYGCDYTGTWYGGGGAGGRVAIYYDTYELTGDITAKGNFGCTYTDCSLGGDGGAGTVYLKDNVDSYGSLIIENMGTAHPNRGSANQKITNISGENIFKSIVVKNAGMINIKGNMTSQNDINVTNSSYFIASGGITNASRINVLSSSTFAHHENDDIDNNMTLTITASNMTIDSTSSINLDYKGYAGVYRANGQGPGAGFYDTSDDGGGAGHGGIGGYGRATQSGSDGYAYPGESYGSFSNPITLGSSGGANYLGVATGGDGGGAVFINITDTLTIEGSITADGGDDLTTTNQADYDNGGGSGGSVYIITDTISGSGSISADGGCGEYGCDYTGGNYWSGGGGAGGRIAVYYNTYALTGEITAKGGFGNNYPSNNPGPGDGGAGTIYLKDNADTYANLIIKNMGTAHPNRGSADPAGTNVSSGNTFKNIIIKNASDLKMSGSITSQNDFNITGSSYLTLAGTAQTANMKVISSSILRHYENDDIDNNMTLNIIAGNMTIDSTSSINLDYRGYAGVYRADGKGPGGGGYDISDDGGGAGHGGAGGMGRPAAAAGVAYGNLTHPTTL